MPSSVFFLEISNLLSIEGNIFVRSEVWDEVIRGWRIWWGSSAQLMSHFSFRQSYTSLGGTDISVLTKVNNRVVHGWRISWSSWGPCMMKVCLSLFSVFFGHLDITVLAEMGDEVVHRWTFRHLERSMHSMTQGSLSFSGVLGSHIDIGVRSKMWHSVINWVVLGIDPLRPLWTLMPWLSGIWRPEALLKFDCSDCC